MFRVTNLRSAYSIVFGTAILAVALSASATAAPLSIFPFDEPRAPAPQVMAYAPVEPEAQAAQPSRFKRHIVAYATREAPGTVVIDTANTTLYLVLGNGRALRYGVGVGRDGFTWSGVKHVERMAEWPDWTPPAEMLTRQPYLPRFMAGGPGNPLGARALYLSGSVYRIHGTNAPQTIGKRVSSGCIRLTNADVVDLYRRVQVGAKVVVLPDHNARSASHGTRRIH
jgi:lipoprotein-anchoring transpeptidase ErfK/SrfK